MSQGEPVDGRWPVVVDAEAAYEAIRSINHRTIWLSDGLPAPAVYWVLAELKSGLGYGAQQALEQLGRGCGAAGCRGPRWANRRTSRNSPARDRRPGVSVLVRAGW